MPNFGGYCHTAADKSRLHVVRVSKGSYICGVFHFVSQSRKGQVIMSARGYAVALTAFVFACVFTPTKAAEVYLQPAQTGVYSLTSTPIVGQWSNATAADFAGVRLYVKPASQAVTSNLTWEIQYEGLQDGFITLADFNSSTAATTADGYKQLTFGVPMTQTTGVQALFYSANSGQWLVQAVPGQFNRFELVPAPEPSTYAMVGASGVVLVMVKAYRDRTRYNATGGNAVIVKKRP